MSVRAPANPEAAPSLAPRSSASLAAPAAAAATAGSSERASAVTQSQAKRTIAGLMQGYRDAVASAKSSVTRQTLGSILDAAESVLAYYVTLPRHIAIRVISDSRLREVRDHVARLDDVIIAQLEGKASELDALGARQADLLTRMIDINERQPTGKTFNLASLFVAMKKRAADLVDLWRDLADCVERGHAMMSSVTHVLDISPHVRKQQDGELRKKIGKIAMSRFMAAKCLSEYTYLNIGNHAHGMPAAAKPMLADTMELLGTFQQDCAPAFASAAPVVATKPDLDGATREVLEGVIARFQEHASGLDDMLSRLCALDDGETPPPEVLEPVNDVIEAIWECADEVTRVLQIHLEAAASTNERTPATSESSARPEEGQASASDGAAKRKDKGKAKKRSGAGEGQRLSPAAPAPTSSMTVVRSSLGTKMLVQAAPAPADSSSSSPSSEPLPQHLERVLQFDLSEIQRAVSQARRETSPENAIYVVDDAVKRLDAQAAKMESCLSAVSDWKQRLRLEGAAINEVHRGEERLKELLPQVKGLSLSFREGKAGAAIDHMKTYSFPTQDHIERLRDAGELAVVETPSALKSEPCTLFEMKLQPRALRNGSDPRPMWVHIHTRKEVRAQELPTLADTDFAACHVKSDAERGRNRQWLRARAKEGHDNVMIYRGKLSTAMCRSLMTTG